MDKKLIISVINGFYSDGIAFQPVITHRGIKVVFHTNPSDQSFLPYGAEVDDETNYDFWINGDFFTPFDTRFEECGYNSNNSHFATYQNTGRLSSFNPTRTPSKQNEIPYLKRRVFSVPEFQTLVTMATRALEFQEGRFMQKEGMPYPGAAHDPRLIGLQGMTSFSLLCAFGKVVDVCSQSTTPASIYANVRSESSSSLFLADKEGREFIQLIEMITKFEYFDIGVFQFMRLPTGRIVFTPNATYLNVNPNFSIDMRTTFVKTLVERFIDNELIREQIAQRPPASALSQSIMDIDSPKAPNSFLTQKEQSGVKEVVTTETHAVVKKTTTGKRPYVRKPKPGTV